MARPLTHQGLKGQRRLLRALYPYPVGVERGSGTDDDEGRDHIPPSRSTHHIHPRVAVFVGRHAFVGHRRLHVDKGPGGDGGADGGQHRQNVARIGPEGGHHGIPQHVAPRWSHHKSGDHVAKGGEG